MRLQTVDEIELEAAGVRGDRRFYLVDDEGALVNAKRLPAHAPRVPCSVRSR